MLISILDYLCSISLIPCYFIIQLFLLLGFFFPSPISCFISIIQSLSIVSFSHFITSTTLLLLTFLSSLTISFGNRGQEKGSYIQNFSLLTSI